MNRLRLLTVFFLLIYTSIEAKLKVILKFDDIRVKEYKCAATPVMEFLIQKQVKCSYGVIAKDLDNTTKETLEKYINAKNSKGENLVEIWHHGYDHVKGEFLGSGYEHQKKHFDDASKIVKDLLGIQMRSFGTPFNQSDSVTYKVFGEDPNYKVFMYDRKVKSDPKKGTLNNIFVIEKGTGNIDFETFKSDYESKNGKYSDYVVLQAHPNGWQSDKIEQLNKIIEFLKEKNCEFVLPYEYYLSVNQ